METLLKQAKERSVPFKKHLEMNETEKYYFDKGLEFWYKTSEEYKKNGKTYDVRQETLGNILLNFIKAVESDKTHYPKFEDFERCVMSFKTGHVWAHHFFT